MVVLLPLVPWLLAGETLTLLDSVSKSRFLALNS